ncbi:MAG: tellurite resistance TerB family protein [Bacteroidetes bacterium]|nr:tellurite resistance TerB family protein [Bacteroidota bacterium]
MEESSPTNLDKQESFLGLIMSVIASDGHISEEEINDFNFFANKSNILRGMSGNQFISTHDKLLKILKKDGIDSLVDLCVAGLPDEYREGVFAVCCDLLFSDGSVISEEEQLLESLKIKLSINDVLAMKIVEVISIKNKV